MSSHSLQEPTDGDPEPGQGSTERSEADGARWRRIGAAAVGGGLLALVLRRRSLGAAAVATVGGLLSYRLLGGGDRSGRASALDATGDGVSGAAATGEGVTASGSITVGRSAEELSAVLRDAEQLDRVLGPVADVEEIGGNRHRYTVGGPLDRSLSWEMRMTDDRPGELVRWTTAGGSTLVDEWAVYLGPSAGDRGTVMRLEVGADPPGGTVGRTVLDRLAPVSDGLVRTVLDRLKSLVETGEIPTIEGNPSGRGEGDLV